MVCIEKKRNVGSRGNVNPLYDSRGSLDSPWYPSNCASKQRVKKGGSTCIPTTLIICGFITDIILLLGTAIFEFFLRCTTESVLFKNQDVQNLCQTLWQEVFPLRRRTFTCLDKELNFSSNNISDFNDFPLKANISADLVYFGSFFVPILIFIIIESLLAVLMPQRNRPQPGSPALKFVPPTFASRLYRFSLIYLFGAFSLMLFVDVIKIFVGRLRPNFLELCHPKCGALLWNARTSPSLTDLNCSETRAFVLKEARTSFPSMQSAITMYAAVTIMIYLHGVGRIHQCKHLLLLSFISLMMLLMATCCGLLRLGHNHNWWTDVISGQMAGAMTALYLGLGIMRSCTYWSQVSKGKLQHQLLSLKKYRYANELRQERLPLYNAESFYNLHGSNTDLYYSVLGGMCTNGENKGHAVSLNNDSQTMVMENNNRTSLDKKGSQSNDFVQQITFRQSRQSTVACGDEFTGHKSDQLVQDDK